MKLGILVVLIVFTFMPYSNSKGIGSKSLKKDGQGVDCDDCLEDEEIPNEKELTRAQRIKIYEEERR